MGTLDANQAAPEAMGDDAGSVGAGRGGSLAYIGRLETGHHDPMPSTLRKLGKALGVPVTALLE